ncbi:MAG TPA: hypothetical protein VNO70_10810 [Blastocatellia bacterium]|nr:hypothetical protein [Blastocatellia bacterium]
MNGGKRASINRIEPEQLEAAATDLTSEQLIEFYLELPKKARDACFVDTAQAAEMAGVTQRTIELWIECGLIRAVRISKRYKVVLLSLKEYLKSKAVR